MPANSKSPRIKVEAELIAKLQASPRRKNGPRPKMPLSPAAVRVSREHAREMLDVSNATLRRLEDRDLLHAIREAVSGKVYYRIEEVLRLAGVE